MEIIRRAFSDTRSHLGGVSGIVVLVVCLLGGVGIHGLLFGRNAMVEQWAPAVSALATYGAVCALLLLYNFAVAPFRLERDRRLQIEGDLAQSAAARARLEEEVERAGDQRAQIHLHVEQAFLGGETEHFPQHIVFGAAIRVSNQGRAPSALDGWRLALVDANGQEIPAQLIHLAGRTVLGLVTGQALAFEESEHIYVKTHEPVGPGQIEGGYLIGFVPKPRVPADLTGCQIRVRCVDIHARTLSATSNMKSLGTTGVMPFMPYVQTQYLPKGEGGDGEP
jgi:hypothetical protein